MKTLFSTLAVALFTVSIVSCGKKAASKTDADSTTKTEVAVDSVVKVDTTIKADTLVKADSVAKDTKKQ